MLKIIQKLKKYIIFLLTVSWYVSISMKSYLSDLKENFEANAN